MRSMIYGMHIILHEKFNAEIAIADIKKNRLLLCQWLGQCFPNCRTIKEAKLPDSFSLYVSRGGPATLPLLEDCLSKNIPVFQSYGMTETSSQIVTLSPEDSITKLGSAGKPFLPSQLKIVWENERGIIQEAGEIVVKGPNVTAGYLDQQRN